METNNTKSKTEQAADAKRAIAREKRRNARARVTEKQKRAAQAVIQNTLAKKPKPMGKILENIGYSEGITKTPAMVTESEGFKAALATEMDSMVKAMERRGINPDKIAIKISELLDAPKITKTYVKGDLITEEESIDLQSIDRGISHALKVGIGGGYQKDRNVIPPANPANLIINFFAPDIRAITKKYEDEIIDVLTKKPEQKT